MFDNKCTYVESHEWLTPQVYVSFHNYTYPESIASLGYRTYIFSQLLQLKALMYIFSHILYMLLYHTTTVQITYRLLHPFEYNFEGYFAYCFL